MFGMFMILPVFSLYASQLPVPATALQTGLAIGLFGLVQALLQIPFGRASDHWGRRRVVIVGLLLLAAGSALATLTDDIHLLMLARALQGSGAVAAVVAAWLADTTRDEVRTQAMAVHGAGVGLSFVGAIVLGPLLAGVVGVPGLFALTGALALLSILPLLAVPDRGHSREAAAIPSAAGLPLWRLHLGSFLLNATMTAMFAALPFAIRLALDLPDSAHWKFYLPVLLGALLPVLPLLRLGRRSLAAQRRLFMAAIAVPAFAMGGLAGGTGDRSLLIAGMLAYFVGFALLQAMMPAALSRLVVPAQRGAAMGRFNTAQVLGAAIGNLLGGWAHDAASLGGPFLVASALLCLWLPLAWSTPLPPMQAART